MPAILLRQNHLVISHIYTSPFASKIEILLLQLYRATSAEESSIESLIIGKFSATYSPSNASSTISDTCR